MIGFLNSASEALMWIIGVIELILGILIIRKNKKLIGILAACVCFGLAFDAIIQGLGVLIGEGAFLKGISQVRYILHGILIPLLIPIAFIGYGIKKKSAKAIVFTITGIVILLGIYMGVTTKTEPVFFAGVLRYGQDTELTPTFSIVFNLVISIGGVIPLIILGIMDLVKHRTPFIMLSGLLMFIASAIPPAIGLNDYNFVITMFGELLMALFFYFEIRCGQPKKNAVNDAVPA